MKVSRAVLIRQREDYLLGVRGAGLADDERREILRELDILIERSGGSHEQ